jgi:8-oxo-dGTP diphosphatase
VSRMASWRLCPACGGALATGEVAGEDHPRLHCTRCGLVLYDNPAPTASAIVERDDGTIMLTLRAIEPARGMWDLPGGFVEVGEDPEQAAIRELEEETGLAVEVTGLVGIFPDRYGDGPATLNIYYRARVAGGIAHAASDVAEIRWFSPADLPARSQLAFVNTADALEAYRASS